MSQAPPNCTVLPSSSKIEFTIANVNEKSSEIDKLLCKLPKVVFKFYYLVHLSTDLRFCEKLKDRNSFKFSSFATNIESELKLIFNNLKDCKVVDVKSGMFGRKTLAIATFWSEVELKKEEGKKKVKHEHEGLIKVNCYKHEQVNKELFDHYNKYGRKLCSTCGENLMNFLIIFKVKN